MPEPTIDTSRAFIAITGEDSVAFLQGILTQDISKLAAQGILFAALLSPQGKLLHDMFAISGAAIGADADILLDTPACHAPLLLKRLAIYKLRAKVTLADASAAWQVSYAASGGFADPRHPALAHRHYSAAGSAPTGDIAPGTYRLQQRALGIPDSADDFEPDSIVAMDAGYDLLHAISFTKGCYVGQEVTARMHYKHIARRGFYLLQHADAAPRLALLKFADVEATGGTVTLDGISYTATLAGWMQPKYDQFMADSGQ